MDRAGQQLLNTGVPLGEPLPPAVDREVQATTFATRQPQVSDLASSAAADPPLITVNVPVMRGSQVPYLLVMSIPPDHWREILRQNVAEVDGSAG